ncbi:uncharacterized protein LOC127748794 [Frankliniella occidentalis]|uniref:Uncharacterized protein LOC127748794 n=1 Tax=Frankliniella occidentalis TaxID=133901 RepID=A0A9C6WKW1_FRAOC|nr:uncharacterized protein LOC127748794 [Frankliniella occidentalis]
MWPAKPHPYPPCWVQGAGVGKGLGGGRRRVIVLPLPARQSCLGIRSVGHPSLSLISCIRMYASRTPAVLAVLAMLTLPALLQCAAQLPSNPYYGNGLQYPAKSGLSPFVYANTASYANTYYLPYAYQNYAPFAPIRT